MTTIIVKKENGNTITINNPNKYEINVAKEIKHLCWDCDNYENCPKILHTEKQPIGKYSFIIDGVQIINNGKIDTFLVSKCEKFYKKPFVPKTKEQLKKNSAKAERARNELKTIYFDVDTIEEANRIQFEQYKKGLLTSIQLQDHNTQNKTKTRKR